MEQNLLFSLLEQSLKYTPVVYKQLPYGSSSGTLYTIEFKSENIPFDGLIFLIPTYSSTGPSTLRLRIPKSVSESQGVQYENKDFTLVVEANNGTTRQAGVGDIISFRMAIIRFTKSTDAIGYRAVLCNSPLYNSATFSSLTATNGEFVNTPVVRDPNDSTRKVPLATTDQIATLERRVEVLEQMITFGSKDPESVLANKPVGAIYIKTEDNN